MNYSTIGIELGVDTNDLAIVAQALEKTPDTLQAEMLRFMEETTGLLRGEAQSLTPTAFGSLRQSIISSATPLPGGVGVQGVAGSALSYAAVVELGSKPHWAPLAPLVAWVKQKGLVGPQRTASGRRATNKKARAFEDDEATRIARRIQFSIAHRGTLGVGMFHRAWAANRAQVAQAWRATLLRVAQQMAGRA